MSSKLIGEILLEKGIITSEQLDKAIKEQKRTGEYIGTLLIRLGYIAEKELLGVLSEQFGIPYQGIKDTAIEDKIISTIPAKYAWHYRFMPLKIKGNQLTIAISNPLDMWLVEDIKLHLGYDVEVVLSSEHEIRESLRKYYGVGAETVEKILEKETVKPKDVEVKDLELAEDIERSAGDASVIKLVNQILTEAIKSRATDIHIEPYRDSVKLRYRIDGVLYDTPISADMKYLHPAMVSRIKIISGLDVVERRLPQDGRAKVRVSEQEIELRISVLPSIYGENIVIRILPTQLLLTLEDLGFASQDQAKLEALIKKPNGIIFLTGPTGSGKTTTLYACLSHINTPTVKIITIEDPVEYELIGVTQIQINPKVGFTFANALRSILRHDPDVMMVGEVRDFETAELAIRTSLTGHLVFSTLHTNDACSAVTRLLDMGIEPFLVASSVEAFIAQRLVRHFCPDCKEALPLASNNLPHGQTLELYKAHNINTIYRGKGCEACKFTGYRGRSAIYEMLLIDDSIRELILAKASSADIKKKALSQGMKTLKDHGLQEISKGKTSFEEVLRVTSLED
jgi:type II secretion system protein E